MVGVVVVGWTTGVVSVAGGGAGTVGVVVVVVGLPGAGAVVEERGTLPLDGEADGTVAAGEVALPAPTVATGEDTTGAG